MSFGICVEFNFAVFVEVESCPCNVFPGREGRIEISADGETIET